MQENNLIGIFVWTIGLIMAITVGSAMINKTLVVPIIPQIVTIISGWIVLLGSIITLVLAVFNR